MLGENSLDCAICGLNCSGCPAFLAFQSPEDSALRERVVSEWKKNHDADIPLEAATCGGCYSSDEDRKCCCPDCPVRACAKKRDEKNCFSCPDFSSCGTRQDFEKCSGIDITANFSSLK
jgi:hypothetical protein